MEDTNEKLETAQEETQQATEEVKDDKDEILNEEQEKKQEEETKEPAKAPEPEKTPEAEGEKQPRDEPIAKDIADEVIELSLKYEAALAGIDKSKIEYAIRMADKPENGFKTRKEAEEFAKEQITKLKSTLPEIFSPSETGTGAAMNVSNKNQKTENDIVREAFRNSL